MTEITYLIDPLESTRNNMLVIRLAEGETNGFDFKLKNLNTPVLASRLKQLATLTDKEALETLIKTELQYQRDQTGRTPHLETTSLHLIHISNNQAISILKLLGDTQKLFFNSKRLVTDFFGKTVFYYRVEILPENRIQVSGRIKWRDYDYDIKECDWIGAGKPHWFIRGLTLKIISTDISWKSLQQVNQPTPWILSGIEKSSFLDDIDSEDPDSPQVVLIGGTAEDLERIPDPLPLLTLKDRSGAFAELWMDYGHNQRIAFDQPIKEIKNAKGEILFKRNLEAEKNWEKDLLETDFIKKKVGATQYYCPLDKVAKSLTFLLELGWQIQDSKGQQVVRQQSMELAMNESKQAIIIKGKILYEGYEADVKDVMGVFNRRERFIELGNGKVGLLPNRGEQNDLQILAEECELIGGELHARKSHIGSLSSLFNQAQMTPSLLGLKERLQNFSQIEEALPTEAFQGKLRPYQQQGLNWLSFLVDYGFHGILADDMGLGKTVQVLALLSRLPSDHPHLIVMPTSLLFNWKNEISKFLPHMTSYLHQGPKRAKTTKELLTHPIILTSYTTLRLDLPLFQTLSYQSVILDEAQVIKNAHTQVAQAVFSLKAQFRLSITGTPIENHLGELWSHFHFLIPELFGDETSFETELQAAESDSRYLQRIRKKIAPFILRRKKEEVAKDLPERIDQVVWIEMGEDQRTLYDKFLAGFRGNLLKKVEVDGLSKHRMEVLEAILRLRQICCHPLLVSALDDEASPPSSAKFEALLQDLETAIEEGRKVLIYSQFTSMLQLMVKAVNERGWKYTYLDGSTANREKVVSAFQEDSTVSFFFISLKAGGVGLNLTAADYVFLYDPWWNEAVEDQAINRAHRLGRKDTVIAKRFVTIESIEEKMMKLKEAKRGIIDDIFSEDRSSSNLTVEDLYFLLE